MSIYVDAKLDDRNAAAVKTALTWHSTIPILAVASYDKEKGGVVSVFHENGSVLKSEVTPQIGGAAPQISAFEWHPTKKILFIGYESGDLSVWNHDHTESNDDVYDRHHQAVNVIRVNENGACLLSGDLSGVCVAWKIDLKGTLSTFFTDNLKEAVTDAVFRSLTINSREEELSRLAQAAVSGDENALNMFSGWDSATKDQASKVELLLCDDDAFRFFVSCSSGVVFYFGENGEFDNVLQMETAVCNLLYYRNRDMLVIMTESLILAQYSISVNGSLTEISKIKLSGGHKTDISVLWAGDGTLSVCAGERTIHLWNVNTGYNNHLSLDDCNSADASEAVTCISYNVTKNVLSAGTNYGQIISWKKIFKFTDRSDDEQWDIDKVLKFQGSVRYLQWNNNTDILAAITATDIYLVSEQEMCYNFKDEISAVQVTARRIVLASQLSDVTVHLLTEALIKYVYLSGDYVALSAGKQFIFYEINFPEKKTKHIGSFSSDSPIVAVHRQNAFVVAGSTIEIRTFQGTLKQTLSFIETEGVPVAIDVCGEYLAVATSKAVVKIWDISRREAKLHYGAKSIENAVRDKRILSIKCNHKGNKLSLTMKKKTRTDFILDSTLYILDIDSDRLYLFDFHRGKAELFDEKGDHDSPLFSPAHKSIEEIEQIIAGRYPVHHFWVQEDPKLIVCEARIMPPLFKNSKITDSHIPSQKQGLLPNKNKPEVKQRSMVVSLYVASEQGLLIQDYFFLEQKQNCLLGIHVPYYYILRNVETSPIIQKGALENSSQSNLQHESPEQYQPVIDRRVLRDFVGMEDCDKTTKEALMMFSYHLTVGNMDEAFRAIRVIKAESVWTNMACMCVKTKRLDVAKVCLGKMEHVRGAMALNEAENETNDVKVGILAVHLDMLEDAEKIFFQTERYDLLNLLYQGCGRWEKALDIAEKHDRIHLRNTYYNYAEHLEFQGDITGAIQMYEKAEVHAFEVPRMLFDKPRTLEAYVLKSKNKEIHKWWAQYLESIDEMESALQFYESAEDYLSLVRLYCYCNNLDKAAEIANETGDTAACFHIGRQYENQDNIKEAIHFFTRARAFYNAIRICKEHGLEDQLMNLALMSGPEEMVDVAGYYEKQESQNDKAILLYHKAGLLTKAVELAFKSREHDALQAIASNLPPNTNQDLLFRCAQLFLETEKYDKAVDLLSVANHQDEALSLCVEHNISITEELAEKLTPSKESNPGLRSEVLEKIGDCCVQQENYHLAAKKYTQAGKKIKAMKALLKSGDTEKIIFFTSVSREREIYIMAANYLQTLNWKQNSVIMKNIITFYTKAKSFDHLSGFYEACAQDEIDEYQNYEKAFGALTEAFKCLNKMDGASISNEHRIKSLKYKIEFVKQFAEIRQNYKEMPEDSIKQCHELLQKENIEEAIRKGDIYGFIVEHFCRVQNYETAHKVIVEMKNALTNVNLLYYVKKEYLDSMCKALGIEPIDKREPKEEPENEDDEEVYQAIEDDS